MFLLLGSKELQAIANVADSDEAARMRLHFSEESLDAMKRLLRSGLTKNRNKAIAIGTEAAVSATTGAAVGIVVEVAAAATAAGMGGAAGAAIGSVLLPGVGTVIGAALGLLIYRNKAKKDDNE